MFKMFKRKKKKVKETKGIKSTLVKEKKFVADAIINAMPDAIIVLDLNGVILFVNPAYPKIFGRKPEEIVGKSFDELGESIKAEDIEKFIKLLGELIETGHVEPVETILRTKDGRELPMSVTYSLIKDAEGNPEYIVASIRDISELKRAQDEVVAARDYMDNIIKSMIDTLIVVDPDGKIKTINKATSDLLGYPEDELIGKPVENIFAEEEEEEEEEDSIFKGTRLKKLIEEGAVRDYDMKYRTKKGDVIPVSFSGSVMRDKDGNLVGIVGIARDMRELKRLMQKEKKLAAQAAAETDRKRATELEKAYKELRSTQENLVQSEKMATLGQLAAGVAHEIRNPLTTMSLSIQHLTKKNYNDFQKEKLQAVKKNIDRINEIVQGLLNFSRPSSNNFTYKNINEILYKLEPTLEGIYQKNIKINKDYNITIPKLWVNSNRLEQVFVNLTLNAIRAMKEGGELNISTDYDLKRKGILIKFEDTGCGIADENFDKIFHPFFTTHTDGTGLGLSVCQMIANEHKGNIQVESKIGKGTVFTVFLPLERRGMRGKKKKP